MGSSSAATKDTESDLIARARQAVSLCNWDVGECAAVWTKRFARGRTDADFAILVGLSPDQIYQRRRVWETFSDVRDNYPTLKWSHFYSALTWDDAAECLQWAEEIQATVAEMKAWRRAQRGEDLTQAADDEPFSLLMGEQAVVKAPFDVSPEGARTGESPRTASASEIPTLTGVARLADEGQNYAPFHDGAVSLPAGVNGSAAKEPPTPEQTIKRITAALERCETMLSAGVMQAFPKLPEKTRQRFLHAVRELQNRAGELA